MEQQCTHQKVPLATQCPEKWKKTCTTEDRFKDKHKKWHFRNIKTTIKNLVLCQQTHNALTAQKIVAVYFRDVKTEKSIVSQDQNLVETTILWQIISDKKTPKRKSTSSAIANWWLEQQWTHQDFLTSQTLSWKMIKFVAQKIASRMNTKKDIFQKHKNQNKKTQNSHELLGYSQLINKPKKQRCVFQRCQKWRNIQ